MWGVARWLAPFRFDGRIHAPLLAAFVALNTIVAINAVIHNSQVGYDAHHHLAYVRALADGHLPSPEESLEFYSAPLPYALPAPVAAIGVTRVGILNKVAQLANIGASLVLTWCVVSLCRRIRPPDPALAMWALLLLGTLPVFYRTMAFIRGEPLCAALAMAACLSLVSHEADAPPRDYAVTGALFGMALLAKQWAVLVVAAGVAWLLWRTIVVAAGWRPLIARLTVIGVLAMVTGGWFYGYLAALYGTPFAFTQDPPPVAINRPAAFYAVDLWRVAANPVRSADSDTAQTFGPVFYADTWGDYWCYFLVSWDNVGMAVISPASHMNALPMADTSSVLEPYLHTLMLAGVLPTLIMLAGAWSGLRAVVSRQRDPGHAALVMCTLAAAFSIGGYLALLTWFPDLDVKASYMLQFFPFAAILGSVCLSRLREWSPRASMLVRAGLIAVLIHNLPAMFSQYSFLGGVADWH
jgi:hypothetical protein